MRCVCFHFNARHFQMKAKIPQIYEKIFKVAPCCFPKREIKNKSSDLRYLVNVFMETPNSSAKSITERELLFK